MPCGITVQLPEAEREALKNRCQSLAQALEDDGVRVRGDYRDNYSPGWKFNHWELKVRKYLSSAHRNPSRLLHNAKSCVSLGGSTLRFLVAERLHVWLCEVL